MKNNITQFFKLTKKGNYKSFYNSDMAARGVAIFIKTGLFDKITVIHKSTSQNVIILKCIKDTNEIYLTSLYLDSSKEDVSDVYNFIPTGANIILGGISIRSWTKIRTVL